MDEPIEDRNVAALQPLDPPRALKAALPLGAARAGVVRRARGAIRDALHGRDTRRLVVVAGPCSIHDPGAALEYAARLRPLLDEHADALVLVMRTYFEKPRTTVGWKGFLNDPHLDGSCDVADGIRRARALLLAILDLGVPCASELLDPVTPQYLADCLSWAAIGARTSESQTHREMASGLSMPVGFKNGTDGWLEGAVNAMAAARRPHHFLGVDAEGRASVVQTRGNPDCHLILRGGRAGPNYSRDDVARAAAAARGEEVPRPVLVDCSHGNSGSDHARQVEVGRAIVEQVREREPGLLGVLLESHLEAGRQDWRPGAPLRRGVSITDACMGFTETAELVREMAAAVRAAPTPAPVAPHAARRTAASRG
jgi:3-deoxy-7-phosphoheptulonate synthase